MSTRRNLQVIVVWFILVIATAASLGIGASHGARYSGPQVASVVIVVLAFGKVALIGTHFMELRHAPFILQITFASVVVSLCGSLVGIYLGG